MLRLLLALLLVVSAASCSLDWKATESDAGSDAAGLSDGGSPETGSDGAADADADDGRVASPNAEDATVTPVDAGIDGSPGDAGLTACLAGEVSGCPANHGCAEPFPCVPNRCGFTCLGQRADWPLPSRTPGEPPAAQRLVVTAATVLDEVTGLMWQRSPHAMGLAFGAARDYCDALDLEGFSDFRLPSTIELTSLLTGSKVRGLDSALFGAPPDGHPLGWAVNPGAAGQHWVVLMSEGRQGIVDDTALASVRCVRRAAERYEGTPQTRFTPVGAQPTTTDRATGLTWEVTVPPPGELLLLADAEARCAQLELGGRSNWRLPQLAELLTTFDVNQPGLLVAPLLAPQAGCYWSGSTNAVTSEDQLFVFFTALGETNVRRRTEGERCLARCVSDTP